MRVVTVQGLGGHKFERELRETLLRETPVDAEVYVSATPETYEVETRVVFDGDSAARTFSFRDPGDLHQQRIVEIVRELVFMLPNQTPSSETNTRSSLLSSEEHSFSHQAISSNGSDHKSRF